MTKNFCPLCASHKIKNLFQAHNWKITFCKDCSNAWTEPPPQKINYSDEDFHSQFPYKEADDLPGQWKRATIMQLELLTAFLEPGSEILEIGCGEGIFIKELTRRGFIAKGIEPSLRASRRAVDSGLDVICGFFPDPGIRKTFKAVVLIQVLEHIPHPLRFLEEIGKVSAGGLALVVQTNWRGLLPRLQKRKWYAWLPEQHYWHFTPKGLHIIFRQLNWKVEKIEYSSLFHRSRILSLLPSFIPGFGDQFHMLVRIPRRQGL